MKSTNASYHRPIVGVVTALAIAASVGMAPAHAASKDLDGDRINNRFDRDVDGDGIANGLDMNVDGGVCRKGRFKGKFVGDRLRNDDPREKDIDGDSLSDLVDDDIDGDGLKNDRDDDCDADGKGRSKDQDDDGDGIRDDSDSDDDNDGKPDDDENEAEALLSPTTDAPARSRVKVKVKVHASGTIELDFDGRGLPEGDYDVLVNGVLLGTLPMEADDDKTEGEVEFETTPDDKDELPLPFNPVGLPVLIAKDVVTYFGGTVPTPSDVFGSDDWNKAGKSISSALKPGSGLPTEAEASVELKIGPKGVTGMEVEVERIPVGFYDVLIDGVKRGVLSVVEVKGKPKGKLRFKIKPEGNGELKLDFPVSGKPVAIVSNGTALFTGNAPTHR